MKPLDFLKGQLPAMIFVFSSFSSVGTLPINMKGCEKMGADKEITSFVLPLGLIAGLFNIAGNYLGAVGFQKHGAGIARVVIIVVLTVFLVRLVVDLI